MINQLHNANKYIALYLILTCSIGPGLIVNHLFKENVGRPRPSQITSFNGIKEFIPIFAMSDQCNHNCSFPSGHAAMGYYFSALAYAFALYRSGNSSSDFTKIYLSAILFGSLVGFSRILMGGHFLSDVVASCFIVLTINHLLYFCIKQLKP
jgi:lipid A 4'-phosphatase